MVIVWSLAKHAARLDRVVWAKRAADTHTACLGAQRVAQTKATAKLATAVTLIIEREPGDAARILDVPLASKVARRLMRLPARPPERSQQPELNIITGRLHGNCELDSSFTRRGTNWNLTGTTMFTTGHCRCKSMHILSPRPVRLSTAH